MVISRNPRLSDSAQRVSQPGRGCWPEHRGNALTIAACYVSPEGVVLGADSTSTYGTPNGPHYYNHAQKLFEIGENSTLGMVTWGLGGLAVRSHRTLIALLADDLRTRQPQSVSDVADRWRDQFWAVYTSPPVLTDIQKCRALGAKAAFDPSATTPDPTARTQAEEKEFKSLSNVLVVGFCIGGYVLPDREPAAYEIIFDPMAIAAPTPSAIVPVAQRFWGAPNIIKRLLFGCDDGLRQRILTSGKWGGTQQELDAIISKDSLSHPIVPIRDAIDFTHACILSTIKAFKFSHKPQICGGPIEIAVITSDRPFRWVRHKKWEAAITEGENDASKS